MQTDREKGRRVCDEQFDDIELQRVVNTEQESFEKSVKMWKKEEFHVQGPEIRFASKKLHKNKQELLSPDTA